MNPSDQPDTHFDNGFITVDRAWHITSCNDTAAHILGISTRFLLGKDCREIFCSDERFRKVCAHLEPLGQKRGSNSIQLTLPAATATASPIKIQVVTIPDSSGSSLGAFISFSDFSTPLAASRLALNSIAEGVFTVDHDFAIYRRKRNRPLDLIHPGQNWP